MFGELSATAIGESGDGGGDGAGVGGDGAGARAGGGNSTLDAAPIEAY